MGKSKKDKDNAVVPVDAERQNEIADMRRNFEAEMRKVTSEIAERESAHFMLGALKKCTLDIKYNETMEAIFLYEVKERKSYKEQGMTWVEFCVSYGKDPRTCERIINDIGPLVAAFSTSLTDFTGVSFKQLRQLGRAVSVNIAENALTIEANTLHYDDEEYQLNKDGIANLIDQLQENNKKRLEEQKAEFESTVEDANKKIRQLREGVVDRQKRIIHLEKLVPEGPDNEWMIARLDEIQEQVIVAINLINTLILKPGIIDAPDVQARAEGFYTQVESRFLMFMKAWNEYTGHNIGTRL